MNSPVVINTTTASNNVASPSSYVAAAKSTPKPFFLKKEQAIVFHSVSSPNLVFHSIDSPKLLDYAKTIGEVVQPKNIIFVSRISNDRICIYLSRIELVDQMIKKTLLFKLETWTYL